MIVLPDSQLNEFIDLNILYSEQDSAEIQSFRGRSNNSETAAEDIKFWKSETAAENNKSETAAKITKSETVTNKKF